VHSRNHLRSGTYDERNDSRDRRVEETTIDRTRRLIYVTCSRAENGLALVIYTHPQLARKFFVEKGWFAADEIECVDQAGDLH
jgi:hypothetical protein